MDSLPSLQPRFAPQALGRRLADPRMAEGSAGEPDELDAAVDEMFTDETTRGHERGRRRAGR